VAVGEELDDKLPHHEYYEYFGPDYTLHIPPSNMANQNSRQEIDNLRLTFLPCYSGCLKSELLVVVTSVASQFFTRSLHAKLEACFNILM
jgi:hypothetical protein